MPRMGYPTSLSIKTILVILFGGITLLAALPTYLYINHIHAQRLMVDRGEGLHDLAQAAGAVIASNLYERRREVELLAQSNLFRDAPLNSPELRDALERTQRSFAQYSWIGLVNLEGIVQTSTGGLLTGDSVKARPWFINGIKESYSGDLHEALLLGKLLRAPADMGPLRLIDFAEPVRDAFGNIRGVLGMHVNWAWASDALKSMQPQNAAQSRVEILIVNQDNKVIYPRSLSNSVELPQNLTSQQRYLVGAWKDGVEYVASMVPVKDGVPPRSMLWRIVIRQPVDQAFSDLTTIRQGLMMTFSLSAVLVLALVGWAASLIAKPLRELAHQASEVEAGNEHVKWTRNPVSSEMQELAKAVQGMAGTLLQRKNALAQSNAVLEQAVAERTTELVHSNEELHRISRRDPLTGLFNRLAADERLHSEFARMKRTQQPYSVLMLDIDFFKRVNDSYGHEVGDLVLQSIANVLQAQLRETDFLARFGGEEFLVILPETNLEAANEVAEKLRTAVSSSDNATGQIITISLGLALAEPGQLQEDDAVRQADRHLYLAKNAGRNRVVAQA